MRLELAYIAFMAMPTEKRLVNVIMDIKASVVKVILIEIF
jgi:hypothetical protein